ncbi:MAG: hypothetical protein KGH78_03320 [Candidatus Micrarchaeota archaeon]|nr:hypothetical protein [Candidatus Micrarchaeota archaeon]
MQTKKAQSVFEFLSTYSWALFAAAIVVAALFATGVFTNPIPIQTCILVPGYTCNHPILSDSGVLSFNLSYIGQTITVTGIGCNSGTKPPSSLQSVNFVLLSNKGRSISVACPISANAFGTAFQGHLWLQYNTQTQSGVISDIGVVLGAVNTRTSTSTTSTTSTSTTSTTSSTSTSSTMSTTTSSTTSITSTTSSSSTSSTSSSTTTILAAGGNVMFCNGNEVHIFTSGGMFSIMGNVVNVAVLVVGGGGGGGAGGSETTDESNGGGGAGGVQYFSNFALSSNAYPVTVGSGGSGAPWGGQYSLTPAGLGQNSIFGTIIANGGGGGGIYAGAGDPRCNGAAGGSGGGASDCNGGVGGNGQTGQGHNGGAGAANAGGGGGGAGTAGSAGSTLSGGGTGGAGIQYSISCISTYYGGGGGGGGTGAAHGGTGGGGNADCTGPGQTNGCAGSPNSGGGGGGSFLGSGGAGGSGIVIVSFNAAGNGTP